MITFNSLFILFAFVIFGCGDKPSEIVNSEKYSDERTLNSEGIAPFSESEVETSNSQAQDKPEGTKLHKIMNSQFKMVYGVKPIPKSWEKVGKNSDNIHFKNDKGVKVNNEMFKSFYYSNNYQMNAYAKQRGSDIKPVKSFERVINEDFKPFLESKGLRLVNTFPIPQIAQGDKNRDRAMFKSTPENKQFQCMATEWVDKDGTLSLGIIRYFTNEYTAIGGMDWGYTLNSLEAPKQEYEEAKKALINSLIGLQVNPNWVRTNNQYYAQMTQQGNMAHNQRMANIENQGRISQLNAQTSSDILDSSHESWKRRNAMTDAGQEKAVNGVWERSNMYDQNGTQYQVDGYNDQVWKNANNEAISSNNPNWNPNTDNATNSVNWEQLTYEEN